MKRLQRIIATVCVLVPALAFAQPKTADEWFKEGENQYNLGQFETAIGAFNKGFELEPSDSKKAAYLFNIAQSYRQLDNCKKAQFFYKRYIAFKQADTLKPLKPEKQKEIEDIIKSLDECAKKQDDIRGKPPDGNPDLTPPKVETKPDQPVVADTTPPGGDDDDDTSVSTKVTTQPKVLSIRASGGGAKLTAGDLPIPVQATVAVLGGYPVALSDKLTLDLGAGFTFTPVPFDTMANESKSAQLIAVMANVGATFEVAPKIGIRGDLGIGALVFTGASESPFTDFAPTTGALSMLHVRVGISGDYAITPNVIATLTPIAFSFSPAASGLQNMGEKISTITAIDFMIGIGYRM